MKDLQVKVLQNLQIAENIRAITFELPEKVEIHGGQFVNLSVGNASLPLRRPLGVCRVAGNAVTVCYQVKGRGTKSLTTVKIGENLKALLPLGNGFNLKNYKKVAVIGGGVGVFPLIYTVTENAENIDFHSFIGFRNAKAVCFADELKAGSKNLVITSDDGSVGIKANAVEAFFTTPDFGSYDAIIACGPPAMLRALKARYAEEGLTAPCFVSLEERMGCGVGACLVCVCKRTDGGNARVCKDGPVFDINAVEL